MKTKLKRGKGEKVQRRSTFVSLAAAFTEWDRRHREEPDRFMSQARQLLKETPQSYGAACAPYLLSILAEQRDE